MWQHMPLFIEAGVHWYKHFTPSPVIITAYADENETAYLEHGV
jgi:hypothetical protein